MKYKILIIGILLFSALKSISQNQLKTQINILKDSLYLGEKLSYDISIFKEVNTDIWVCNLDNNKGAEIFIINNNNEIHLDETSIVTCWGCDDIDREIFYAPEHKKSMVIQNHAYDIFQKNNKIEDYIQADSFKLKFSFLTHYQIPSQNQKDIVGEMMNAQNGRIFYFHNDSLSTMEFVGRGSYSTDVYKTIFVKKFYGVDEKAYKWLEKNNMFWQLFLPYDKAFSYQKYKKFIKKFPTSCFTYSAKYRLTFNLPLMEWAKIYADILNSDLVDYYKVKPEIEKVLNDLPELKSKVNAMRIEKK